jgi:hypothetical protein
MFGNSVSGIYDLSEWLSNQGVRDIDQVRRDNMRLIEQECGGPTEAARKLEMSPAQYANLRNGAKDSKTGKPRGMRKETARRIEEQAGKPAGWLDEDHSNSAAEPEPRAPSLADSLEALANACAAVSPAVRADVAQVVDLVVRNPAVHSKLQIPVVVQMLSGELPEAGKKAA